MTLKSLKTAEQVTRFLRNRSESNASNLISVAEALHSGRLPIYLPQKDVVLLEWLLDRMEGHQQWRVSSEAWQLAVSVWNSLSRKVEARARVLKNRKFVQSILIPTIKDLTDIEADVNAITEFLTVLSAEVGTLLPRGDHVVVEQLLCATLDWAVKWTNKDYFKQLLTALHMVVKPSLSRGIRLKHPIELVSPLFVLLSIEDSPLELHNFVGGILSGIFINSDLLDLKPAITPNTDVSKVYLSILSSPSRKLANSYFEQLMMAAPGRAKSLLQLAVAENMPPEPKMLEMLLDAQLTTTPDWDVVIFLLQLDREIVLKRVHKIYSTLNEHPSVGTAVALVQAHSQPKDLPSLFANWKKLISNNRLWRSAEVVAEIGRHLKALSPHQINELLESLLENNRPLKKQKRIIPAMAIVESLQSSSLERISRVREGLFKVLQASSEEPKLKYAILSLGKEFVVTPCENGQEVQRQRNIAEQGPSEANPGAFHPNQRSETPQKDVGDFSVVFRTREFLDVDTFDQSVEKALAYLQMHPLELEKISHRWLVLVNNHFNNSQLAAICGLYIDNPEMFEDLVANELLYEQSAVTTVMINKMVDGLKAGYSKHLVDGLCHFPIEVYSKTSREQLLDVLLGHERSDPTTVRRCVNHLLMRPCYSSKIETDYTIIEDLFKSIEQATELDHLTTDICSSIVQHHLENSNQTSNDFLSGLMSSTQQRLAKRFSTERLDKKISEKHLWVLKIGCILARSMEVSVEFNLILLNGIVHFLGRDISPSSSSSVTSLLGHLKAILSREFQENYPTDILDAVKEIVGGVIMQMLTHTGSELHQQILFESFAVVALLSSNYDEIDALTALYIIIGKTRRHTKGPSEVTICVHCFLD
jgi:hypothetical protein